MDLEMSGDFARDERYKLKEELYFTVDERQRNSDLTEMGRKTLRPDNPQAFMLPDLPSTFIEVDKREDLTPEQKQKLKQEAEQRFAAISEEIHGLAQLLIAYTLYERDKEYVVLEGKVHIVDENTGRLMHGRRWSEACTRPSRPRRASPLRRRRRPTPPSPSRIISACTRNSPA